jgi:hypothetical protein
VFDPRKVSPGQRLHEAPWSFITKEVLAPVDVWGNLAVAYPLPRNAKPFIPGGIDLTDTVAARLHLWAVTTTGHWVGWITYENRRMNGVTGWMVAAALEPRFGQPARRDGGNVQHP